MDTSRDGLHIGSYRRINECIGMGHSSRQALIHTVFVEESLDGTKVTAVLCRGTGQISLLSRFLGRPKTDRG